MILFFLIAASLVQEAHGGAIQHDPLDYKSDFMRFMEKYESAKLMEFKKKLMHFQELMHLLKVTNHQERLK